MYHSFVSKTCKVVDIHVVLRLAVNYSYKGGTHLESVRHAVSRSCRVFRKAHPSSWTKRCHYQDHQGTDLHIGCPYRAWSHRSTREPDVRPRSRRRCARGWQRSQRLQTRRSRVSRSYHAEL